MTQKKKRGCLWWLVRAGGGILLIIILLIAAGLLFEAQAENRVRATYPPPGEIVTVNDHNMHIICEGEGTPTIVLDAGQGGWSTDWQTFIAELSQDTRVCAYDRSGYGWSETANDDRSPQIAAEELAALLTAAAIDSPYLLVGFSHAALADRIFAAQNINDMAGLILIDPATEFDNDILGEDLLKIQRSTLGVFQGFELAARLGIIRLVGPENMAGYAPFIAEEPANHDLYYTFIAAPQWWATSAQEFASGMNDEHLQLVSEQGAIPDIPLIIIGSDTLTSTDQEARILDERERVLTELALQSSQGEFILAEGSTHNIPADRPDVILAAIRTMLP